MSKDDGLDCESFGIHYLTRGNLDVYIFHFIPSIGASQDGISSNNQEETLFKRNRHIHKRVLEVFNDSSSYMAVPARATIISSLLLVPYMGVVPAMTMAMSSSITTTAIFLVSTPPILL
jgi:hypothetical protein